MTSTSTPQGEPLCRCGNPVRDAALCTSCAYQVDEAIAQICEHHGLGWDLEVALSRQDKIERRGSGRPQLEDRDEVRQWPGTLRPGAAPFDDRAAEAATELRKTLASWADVVAAGIGVKDWTRTLPGPWCRRCEHATCLVRRPPKLPPADIPGLAAWLRPHVGWLRHHADAQRAHDEILDVVRRVRRVIDRPAELLYAGPCEATITSSEDCGCPCHIGGAYPPPCNVPGGCGTTHPRAQCQEHLYARPGALSVTCRCGATHEVEARRRWLLQGLDDYLGNAQQIGRLVSYLGITIPDRTIRWWGEKHRLIAHGNDKRGNPMYRLGDVVRTYYEAEERKAAKKPTRQVAC